MDDIFESAFMHILPFQCHKPSLINHKQKAGADQGESHRGLETPSSTISGNSKIDIYIYIYIYWYKNTLKCTISWIKCHFITLQPILTEGLHPPHPLSQTYTAFG